MVVLKTESSLAQYEGFPAPAVRDSLLMENFDINLVTKYLAGEASGEERQLVKKWKKANPQAFKDLQKIWTASEASNYEPAIRFDKAAAWEKTISQIDLPETATSSPKTVRIRGLGYWLPRIAALLIIGLAASYLLRPGNTIKDLEFIAEAGTQNLELPDGSAVDLRQGGNITYPANFEEDRSIVLEGVAFFDVAKDSVHPFTIKTNRLLVTVTGTSFYVDDDKEEVGVSSGSVKVENQGTGQFVLLSPGQRVSYDDEKQAFSTTLPVEENELFWKNGVLVFRNQPLENVLATLARVYGVTFDIEIGSIHNCPYTGRFKDVSLATIIEELNSSLGIEISQKEDKTYVVPPSTCEM